MRTLLVMAIGVLGLVATGGEPVSVSVAAEQPTGTMSPRQLLDRYCVTCHNERLRTAELTLDTVDVANLEEHAETWEKVARKLRAGAMPPTPRPRPDEETYNAFANWIESGLDSIAAREPNPGRTEAFHRLNRTEYHNVIRDLLALEVDVAESNVAQLSATQPAEVTVEAFPNKRYRAELRQIIPTADRTKATVMVKVTILDTDPNLKPEMSARATFLASPLEAVANKQQSPVLIVPENTVVTRNGRSHIFVITDRVASLVPVTTGGFQNNFIVIGID